jgi:hypothetical protein
MARVDRLFGVTMAERGVMTASGTFDTCGRRPDRCDPDLLSACTRPSFPAERSEGKGIQEPRTPPFIPWTPFPRPSASPGVTAMRSAIR